MLAYFMSRIKIDVDVNDVLPPNWAQILVKLDKFYISTSPTLPDHLRDTIRIATTKVIPNLQSIIQRKQLHPSHCLFKKNLNVIK